MNRSSQKHVRDGRPANRPRSVAPVDRRRKARRGKRRNSFAPTLAILAVLTLAMIPLMIRLFPRDAATVPAARIEDAAGAQLAPRPTAFEAPTAAPAPQYTETPTAAPTPEPTPQPTPTPTPEPTLTPEPTAFQYLPVIHGAKTESKMIAITVDDCYQVENLKTIASVASKNGAKLTLFPIGENLSKEGMPELLKRCAFDLGFEIENHTWSHARIFRLSDEEMAAEIWKQDEALNKALGVNYQEHFLRLMGGDGDTDPRIHSYLEKLGYLGIAYWSYSGSDSDLNHIRRSLAPGQVYLFHCTDPDTKKLKEFIPYAVNQGYKLVTLNQMFNLPDNETSALTAREMIRPEANVDDHHTLTEGEYTWVAARLQDVLRELGYLEMDGPSTGYYGPQTVKAVKRYQQDNGLPVTGEADEALQKRLLG